MPLTLRTIAASVLSIGLIVIGLVLTSISLSAQRSGGQSELLAATTRLEGLREQSTLRTGAYRTPCLSANILGASPVEITKRELSNRAELRLRAVGLNPVPFENCALPDADSTVATRQQMNTLWLSVEPWFPDASTFNVQVKVFRIVKWQVGEPTRSDDGFRARLLSVNAYSEPVMPGRLRHDGRAAAILEAVDRLMDGFLVDYLRANQR